MLKVVRTSEAENEGVWSIVGPDGRTSAEGEWARDIDVLWSPDCRYAALGIAWGSNVAEVEIHKVEDGTMVGSDKIRPTLPMGAEVLHRYDEPLKWLNSDSLLVRVRVDYYRASGLTEDTSETWVLRTDGEGLRQ